MVMIKKYIKICCNEFVERIDVECDSVIVLKTVRNSP